MKSAEELVESRPSRALAGENAVRREPKLSRPVMRLFEGYSKLVFAAYCPLSVTGRDRLPNGPFILCSNHCSHMDSTVLMAGSGRPFDQFGLIAARDYFVAGGRWKAALNLIVNVLPVDRRGTRKAILEHVEQCRQFVRGGDRYLIMYPEGTRSTTGKMQAFKKGAGMLAVELNIPLVPAYIDGTFARWRKGTRLIKPGPVRVSFGTPVYPGEFACDAAIASNPEHRQYALLTEALEDRVRRLAEDISLAKDLGHAD